MSDGGEGFAATIASSSTSRNGSWKTTRVTGPLGAPVSARWWLDPPEAIVESASASGLTLAGGASGNDPLAATSRGTGELIAAAFRSGAREVLLGVGGSATTDGGLGALEALERAGLVEPEGRISRFEIVVAFDVVTSFVQAASEFGPQKGASEAQVVELGERLTDLARLYRERFGVDVTSVTGSGAAGGLAGGLAAVGARLVPGFDLVAGRLDLGRRIGSASLVVTGEGCLDSSSWSGKVVAGVVSRALAGGVPVLVVAGDLGPGGLATTTTGRQVEVVSLTERFGRDRALSEPTRCTEEVVAESLDRLTMK